MQAPARRHAGLEAARWVMVLALLGAEASPSRAQTISFMGQLGGGCTDLTGSGTGVLPLAVEGVPAGDTILIGVAVLMEGEPTTTLTVTDSAGNPYVRDLMRGLGLWGFTVDLYTTHVAFPTGPAGTVSIAFQQQPTGGEICASAAQVRGLARLAPDTTAVAVGFSATAYSIGPTIATSQPSELAFAVVGSFSGNFLNFVPSGGYSGLTPVCQFNRAGLLPPCLSMAYRLLSEIGPETAAGQLGVGGAQHNYIGLLATYKAGAVKGDLDGDGLIDLVFQNPADASAKLWPMNGVSLVGAELALSPQPGEASARIVGVDEFNGDAHSDLVFRDAGTGDVTFWMMDGAARLGSPVPLSGAAPPPLNWTLAATGDFNHDGHADLLWRNETSQKLVVWTMGQGAPPTQKTGIIVPSPDQAVDANWSVAAALDFSADGLRDLLWYNSTSGKLVVWKMNANLVRISGNFTSPAGAANANWKVVAGGDYGPGPGGVSSSNDVVWRNVDSGKLVVWHMDPTTEPISRTSGEFTAPDSPVDPLSYTVVGPK